jgi:pimeloyl-ACP methyl ester carboxylesterase
MTDINLIVRLVAFGMLGLTCWVAGAATPDASLPAVLYTDPPLDPTHPAIGQGIQFHSHGAILNGQLYRPAGDGVHPTVVLLHGLPGNEQNLDLAQSMRRAGWTVITFHYTGSWGSGGRYTLKGGIADAKVLLDLLAQPASAQAWGVDPSKIVLVGHSYGGYVAARAAAETPGLLGVVLLAPWDISFDTRAWAPLPQARRNALASAEFEDAEGRLAGANAHSILAEVMRDGAQFDLSHLASALTRQHILIITAERDTEDDKAIALLPALTQVRAEHLTVQTLPTDHSFNDHRIALQTEVLRWLAALPGAPSLAPN